MITGSEQGWREASHDSRRHDKARDIKRTITKMTDAQAANQAAFEKQMEDDYFEGALAVAHGMLDNRSFGYTRGYARNYDKVFGKGDDGDIHKP